MTSLFNVTTTHPHAEYIALRDDHSNIELRQFCEEAWSKFEKFADLQFPVEFALQPRQRFWEMYLAVYLLENNFDLRQHNPYAPDLHVVVDNQNVWIEATVPSEGTGSDSVPSPYVPDPNRLGRIPEDKIILRFANAISEKWKKYNAYLNDEVISPNDMFVIAINGMDIAFECLNPSPIPSIARALFGIGKHEVIIDMATLKPIEHRLSYRGSIEKLSGGLVSTAPFLDSQCSGVSGVLYSNAPLWEVPRSPGDEFIFIHNYVATIGLDKGWIRHGKYCWLENNQFRIESARP